MPSRPTIRSGPWTGVRLRMATARGWVAGSARWRPFVRDAKAVVHSAKETAHILEFEAKEGFGGLVDKDQVARRIDHEGRDCQSVGELANQDQLNGKLGHGFTTRIQKALDWLIRGVRDNPPG